MGFGMPNPTKDIMFINALMDDMNSTWANIPTLISLICCFTWLMLLASLSNTVTFGPRVAMILKMVTDIVQFLIIYIMQLMAFALVASMAFVKIDQFNGFYETILYLYNASFGSYSLTLFDSYDRPEMRIIGQAFLIFFVFVNLILLLNMVIAMMGNTFGAMSEISKGVYNHAVLQSLPQYKMNKYYGGIVAMVLPLSILSFLTLPLFLCIRNKTRLRQLSDTLKTINYFFIMLPITVIFMVLNLALLPFAYVRTLVVKIHLSLRTGAVCEAFFFLLLGVPLLMTYQVFDLIDFMRWSASMVDPSEKVDKTYISKQSFKLFY